MSLSERHEFDVPGTGVRHAVARATTLEMSVGLVFNCKSFCHRACRLFHALSRAVRRSAAHLGDDCGRDRDHSDYEEGAGREDARAAARLVSCQWLVLRKWMRPAYLDCLRGNICLE